MTQRKKNAVRDLINRGKKKRRRHFIRPGEYHAGITIRTKKGSYPNSLVLGTKRKETDRLVYASLARSLSPRLMTEGKRKSERIGFRSFRGHEKKGLGLVQCEEGETVRKPVSQRKNTPHSYTRKRQGGSRKRVSIFKVAEAG